MPSAATRKKRWPWPRTQEEEMRRGEDLGSWVLAGGVSRRPRDVQWQHRDGVVVCEDEEEEAARKGEVLVLIRVFKRFKPVFFVHPPS